MKKLVTIILAGTIALCLASCNSENGKTATGEAVMVMDTAIVSSNLKEISAEGTLVFNNLTAEEIPAIGDVICSAPSKAAPQGFLYKVKEITTRDNETTIVTEMATIEESVKKAFINQTFNLTVAEVEKTKGVNVQLQEYAAISAKQTVQYAGFFDFLWGNTNTTLPDTKLTLAKLFVDVPFGEIGYNNTVGIKGSLKGSIDLSSMFHCELKIKNYSLKHLLLATKPQFKAQLAATIEGKMTAEKKVHIATFKYAPVVVMVGSFPIVFTPTLAIDAVISLSGEVSLQATLVDWNYSYTFGCSYDGSEWNTISENTSQPAKYLEDIQLFLKGSVKVQPQLSYKYELYNTGNTAGISGNLYAKLENNISSERKLSFYCGLEFGTEGELKIFSRKIGNWKLTFCLLDWLIWEKILTNEYYFEPSISVIEGIVKLEDFDLGHLESEVYTDEYGNESLTGNHRVVKDRESQCYVIYLDKPISIICNKDCDEPFANESTYNISKIQVLGDDKMPTCIDKKVRLTGTFYMPFTAYYCVDVAMNVDKIEILSTNDTQQEKPVTKRIETFTISDERGDYTLSNGEKIHYYVTMGLGSVTVNLRLSAGSPIEAEYYAVGTREIRSDCLQGKITIDTGGTSVTFKPTEKGMYNGTHIDYITIKVKN